MSAKPDTWMPFYIGDYLRDTSRLTTEGHGAYLLLIMDYWVAGKPLPDDNNRLAAIARMPLNKWKSLRPIIAEFFQVGDGVWRHKRIDEELEEANDRITKLSAAGAAGAAARWGQKRANRGADANSNRMPTALANAFEPQSDGNASGNADRYADCNAPSPSQSKLASNPSEKLPRGWIEEAAAERAAAGLPEVDLPAEWAKFRKVSGDNPALSRWVKWALKADGRTPKRPRRADGELPEIPWEQRLDGWVRKNFWLDVFGPRPDEPGCGAPPDMIRAAIEARRQNGAAHAAA